MGNRIELPKPKGFKSCRIVYDPHAILVINLDYTVFQAHYIVPNYEFDDEYQIEILDQKIVLSVINPSTK